MSEKNNCSYTDRNSEFNAMANKLYSPKKELFSNMCSTTTDCELSDICSNPLLDTYSSFTSCGNEGYFVTKDGDNQNLYVLDSNLNEVDQVNMALPNTSYNKDIQGIAYDPDLAKMYVAHNNRIFSVNNQGDFIKDEVNLSSTNTTRSSCCTSITSTATSSPANISAIGIADNNLLTTYDRNGSSFVAKVTSSGNLVNETHLDDSIEPSSILETSSGIHVLAKKNGQYNYIYTFDKQSSNCKKSNCCKIIMDGECRVDIECPDLPCDLEGSLCEVVRSIALIENAIAKLIDSESCKIKAAIDNTSCNKELIDINNSVSKTIMNITLLEQILKDKLEKAIELHEKTSS